MNLVDPVTGLLNEAMWHICARTWWREEAHFMALEDVEENYVLDAIGWRWVNVFFLFF